MTDIKSENMNWRERRRINREVQKAQTAKYYEDMRNKTLQSNDISSTQNTSEVNYQEISTSINTSDTYIPDTSNINENLCAPLKERLIDETRTITHVIQPDCISKINEPKFNELCSIDNVANVANVNDVNDVNDDIVHNALIKTMTDNHVLLEQHISEIEKELYDTNNFIKSLDLEKKALCKKSAEVKAGIIFNDSLYEFNSQIKLLNIDVNKCDSNIYEEQKKLHDQITAKNYARGLGVTNRELSSYYNKYINI